MPAALTTVRAVSPPVRARAPTPMGMATAMAGSEEGRPCNMAWSRSHSLTKPQSGGHGGHGQAADQEDAARHRHAPQEPSDPVEVPGACRLLERACRQEQRSLEDGVEDHVQEGGDQR